MPSENPVQEILVQPHIISKFRMKRQCKHITLLSSHHKVTNPCKHTHIVSPFYDGRRTYKNGIVRGIKNLHLKLSLEGFPLPSECVPVNLCIHER